MKYVKKSKSRRNILPPATHRSAKKLVQAPSATPNHMDFLHPHPKPWRQLEAVHMVRTHGRATIRRLFSFGDMGFDIRADIEDAALLVRNAVTGVHKFLSRTTTLLFFRDQLSTHTVARTWNASDLQPKGSLPHVLGQKSSRALKVDTNAAFRARGGNPDRKSVKNLRPRRVTKPLTRKPYFSR